MYYFVYQPCFSRTCLTRLSLRVKLIKQIPHDNSIPSCVLLCVFKLLLTVNTLPHVIQLNILISNRDEYNNKLEEKNRLYFMFKNNNNVLES
jgi:hypothetical protein